MVQKNCQHIEELPTVHTFIIHDYIYVCIPVHITFSFENNLNFSFDNKTKRQTLNDYQHISTSTFITCKQLYVVFFYLYMHCYLMTIHSIHCMHTHVQCIYMYHYMYWQCIYIYQIPYREYKLFCIQFYLHSVLFGVLQHGTTVIVEVQGYVAHCRCDYRNNHGFQHSISTLVYVSLDR